MLTITVHEGKLKRGSTAPVPDVASINWQEQHYACTTPHGALCDLARELIKAGCPDGPWEARDTTGKLRLTGRSLHRLALLRTTMGYRFYKWKEFTWPDAEEET